MQTADVTISIATHNRCEDLVRTCRALEKLDPPPAEIIICADGCSDDTVDVNPTRLLFHITIDYQR